jgi:hypothetical protein
MRPETTATFPRKRRRSTTDLTLISPLSNRPNPGRHAGLCRPNDGTISTREQAYLLTVETPDSIAGKLCRVLARFSKQND